MRLLQSCCCASWCFLSNVFLNPGEPWRMVFRVVVAVACVIVLLNAIAGPVIW